MSPYRNPPEQLQADEEQPVDFAEWFEWLVFGIVVLALAFEVAR